MATTTKKAKKNSDPAAGGKHPAPPKEEQPTPAPPQVEQPAPALGNDGPAQTDQEAPSEGASASAMPAVGGGLVTLEPAPKKARTEAAVVPPRPAVGGSAPPVPTPITSADVISAGAGAADPVAKYIAETVDYVNYHLTRYLEHPPPGSKLNAMTRPLAKQPPIDIESMAVESLTSFREAYKYNNAQKALQLLAMYEGAGNLFWFDVKAPNVWKATSLGGGAVSLAQLIAASTLFTQDQLIASCPENENLRFLAFPIFLPSAVGDLDDVKKQGANSVELTEIPLFAGHATVMGWYNNMAAALSATKRDHDYIRHLYQASLAVPVRLRLDPSVQAVQLDTLAYSEMLRQSGTACIDSFWEFVSKIATLASMRDVLEDKKKTIKDVIAAAERFKLRFKGKALSTAMAQGIKALHPYVQDETCKHAYRLLETVSTCMNDLTKLWKLAQVTSTQFANLGTKEALGSFARVLTHLRVDLSSNAVSPPSVSADWLTAYKQPKVPGYAHYVFKQASLVDYMDTVVRSQPDTVAYIQEILTKVLPVLSTPDATYRAFASKSLPVADGPGEGAEIEFQAAVGAEQFGERTADLFKTFKDSLTEQPSKIYADMLNRVWSGEVAEELKLRAAEDLSSQQPVPWLKYLQSDGKGTQTLLQTLWLEYQQSVMKKPVPIQEGASAVGDEVTDATADERGRLASTLHELRVKKVTFVALPPASSGCPLWCARNLEAAWASAALGRMWKGGKESGLLLIASADLFPPHAEKYVAAETPFGIIGSVSDDFTKLVKFMQEKKESRDCVMVFDGRSRAVSHMLWNLENFTTSNHATELTIIYNATVAKKDCRAVASKQKMFSASNKETCFVLMSRFGNKRPAIQARTSFNKCGESSTYDTTYPGVVHRHLSQIPRLSDADVQAILGPKGLLAAAGADKVKGRHLKEVQELRGSHRGCNWAPQDVMVTQQNYKSLNRFKP